MLGMIRLGDPTSSAGQVLQASSSMTVDGVAVARKGDLASCPIKLHGNNPIAEGDEQITDHGIPVAFHGHKLSCGCSLISSLTEVGKA